MNKVVLITGGSSGIGRSTAIKLNNEGYKVYVAARSLDKMQDLKNLNITPIYLNLTNEQSIVDCVNFVLNKENKIDILINNAGYGFYGAIEDVSIQNAKNQMEVNLFGLARITQLVLPSMRKNHSGKIINISSMAGKMWTKYGAWYHASKYAIEGLSNSMRLELKQFNIDVILIEPGVIKTDWGFIAANNLKTSSMNSAYKEDAAKVANWLEKLYRNKKCSSPDLIANTIYKAIKSKKPRTHYLVGYLAKSTVFVKNIVGSKIYDFFFNKLVSK